MSVSMLCTQCGLPAERCARCAGALCARRLCAELHDASCAAVSTLPPVSAGTPPVPPTARVVRARPRRQRNEAAERQMVEALVLRISQHRLDGRAALLVGDLDRAVDELWSARELEHELDRLGPAGRQAVPDGWEIETDLTPLARALASRSHAHGPETWRRVLDDGPARSIQAEAAEWLAREAFGCGQPRAALRILHAGSVLGRGVEPDAFRRAYKLAGLDPSVAFGHYLAATRLDPPTARASGLRDPLTDRHWADQDPRWWKREPAPQPPVELSGRRPVETDHQQEALNRARDLVQGKRDQGWLLLAEGDYIAGPLGVRTLGRNVRSGAADPADHDAFVRIRLAYEGAADRLPDVAWPWYRLAELLAWAGFSERAQEHLAQAERRRVGKREAERRQRPALRALVHSGLGLQPDGVPTVQRPFPAEPFGVQLAWRLRLR